MKRLTKEQKLSQTGGSFYAIALGVGILVSTVSTLVCNAITAANAGNMTQADAYSSLKRSTMIRLSPVPSRSSVMVI